VKSPREGAFCFRGREKDMKISDLCRVLAEIQREHGDLPVECGRATIRGFAVYPASATQERKVVSILAYYELPDPPIAPAE
jgi:hypothetical protein